jgi:hypothetical protein
MELHLATAQSGNPRRTDSKSCKVCGRTIQWRRRLAENWHEVKYCSASCRRASVANARTDINQRAEAYDIAVDSVGTAA